ncbi:hypothetical protein, partial [Rhodococcus chondri]
GSGDGNRTARRRVERIKGAKTRGATVATTTGGVQRMDPRTVRCGPIRSRLAVLRASSGPRSGGRLHCVRPGSGAPPTEQGDVENPDRDRPDE